jgi:hypothetical protein
MGIAQMPRGFGLFAQRDILFVGGLRDAVIEQVADLVGREVQARKRPNAEIWKVECALAVQIAENA